MRLRLTLFLAFVLFATNLMAGDRWIPIAGTVSNFRTDTRVFNPSGEKDIEVSAYFLPVGALNNNERIAGTPVKFTVAKRSMKVLDDVVTLLFSTTGIGAILLTSPDEFAATSRIYATVAAGTLGQFSPAQAPGLAFARGVVIQLKSTPSAFRTNVGAVNIANATTTVTWNLYDKTNKKVASAERNMAAYEVMGPTNIVGLFTVAAGTDLTDAWVSYQASNPIFAYGSIVDNGTTDQTFSGAVQDLGSDPTPTPEPQPEAKRFEVTLQNWSINISGTGLNALKVGDRVTFNIRATNGEHGFILVGPSGQEVIPDSFYQGGRPAQDHTFTVNNTGTYTYFCTVSSCGVGHGDMVGTFRVP